MDINLLEVYKPHPDFPQYAISSFGNVYSINYKRNLKVQNDKDGYRYVFLRINGQTKRKQVHRLMGETFIPNPTNQKMVCFKTSRKDVPKVRDLFWCNSSTKIRNSLDRGFYPSKRTRRKERVTITDEIIYEVIQQLLKGKSYNFIADKLNISRSVVYGVKHNKYRIKFPENINYFVFKK